jgi:hypothetical protein
LTFDDRVVVHRVAPLETKTPQGGSSVHDVARQLGGIDLSLFLSLDLI